MVSRKRGSISWNRPKNRTTGASFVSKTGQNFIVSKSPPVSISLFQSLKPQGMDLKLAAGMIKSIVSRRLLVVVQL